MYELQRKMADLRLRREDMVTEQLVARGIRDARVLSAMRAIPRHQFVCGGQLDQAYDDCPLPIGHGQTISQPYMVALMLAALELRGHERVLDVGTGSGYQAAVLGWLSREVYSVEIIPELAALARSTVDGLGIANVRVVMGDGSIGLSQAGPFDAIVVAAGAPEVPALLLEQLADGGTLVMPVGGYSQQELVRVRKQHGAITRESITPCIFVPLVGEQGWATGQAHRFCEPRPVGQAHPSSRTVR